MKTHDTNQELFIMPYKSGLKLLQPLKQHGRCHQQMHQTRIADVLSLSCNTYFLNRESKVVNGNLANARMLLMGDISESIGKSLADTPYLKEDILRVHEHDRQVFLHERSFYFDEIIQDNEESRSTLSIKFPIYGNKNIIGIFGFSIEIGRQPLAESLSEITKMRFMRPFLKEMHFITDSKMLDAEKIYLTPKEIQLLQLIVQGKICPEIAFKMNLSKRTIEHYMANLKQKFNVASKQELIEKVIYLMRDYHLDV